MKHIKYILICLFYFIGICYLHAKNPGFKVDHNEGCDSLKVTFTLDTTLSTNNSNQWIWDFGDSTGTETNSNSTTHWYYYNTDTSKYHGIFKPKLTVWLNVFKTSDFTDTIETIRVRPHPNANFFIADTFNLGNLEYRFLSGKAPDTIKYSYFWNLNPGGITDTAKAIHKPGNEGRRDLFLFKFSQAAYGANADLMRLIVKDDFGCADTFQQRFDVYEKLYIPNVFTPNGDGINDLFTVQTNGKIVYHFQVFTSSGQLVFESTSRSISWDGTTSAGAKALGGTYFYTIDPGLNKKPYSGFFMLLGVK
jgi:gliding motility-associated-like protein